MFFKQQLHNDYCLHKTLTVTSNISEVPTSDVYKCELFTEFTENLGTEHMSSVILTV